MSVTVRPLEIGGVKLANNLVLAPMAGISDSPFRRMCLKGGAGLVCAEMVSACAVKYENAKTRRMLFLAPDEHPCSVQIFGSDRDSIRAAVSAAEENGADILDINAGCPVKKVIKSGSGSALMRDPVLFAAVVSAAVENARIPVTVKFRTALREGELLGPQFATIAQDCGAAAVTVHARPASSFHEGPVDFAGLEATCRAVSIPVIGNGGIHNAQDARRMFDCGVSGIMIGRGAVGDPFIFKNLGASLNGAEPCAPSPRERLACFLDLLSMSVEHYGERMAIVRARKVAGYWIRGFEGASGIRAEFVRLDSLCAAKNLFLPFLASL
ncbi:MAG: tRNA-dihydrouridine synthase [Elusimicrobiaceae bacterium]